MGKEAISGEEDPHVKEARQQMEREPSSMTTRSRFMELIICPAFKCAVTVPGDNSVDIYSQDLSLVVLPMTKKELEDLTSLPVAVGADT